MKTISRLVCVASLFGAGSAALADSISLDLNSTPVGPLAGDPDGRAPGNGSWWLPDNAATSGTIEDGIGYNGTRGLVVGNRGNGFDGVVDNIHSPQLSERAGESGFNDNNNTTFVSSYRFRTASTTPVEGLRFTSEMWGQDRTTFFRVFNDGFGNLKANYSGFSATQDDFTNNIPNATLNWGEWYRVQTTINFVDGPSNDTVEVKVFDDSNNLVFALTDTTWEDYFRNYTSSGNPTGVNSIGFQARRPINSSFEAQGPVIDRVAYVDDISYASVPTPGTAAALGLAGLVGLRRRR